MAFLNDIVAFLSDEGMLPEEVRTSDTNREKTYLQYLPDAPAKAYCVRLYATDVPTLVGKQSGVHRIQIIMRNPNHAEVYAEMYRLWEFLINRPEPIEDFKDSYMIIDAQQGPIPLGQDEKGNYLYSINVPIKTTMY